LFRSKFQIFHKPINEKEIELHDIIKVIIKNSMNDVSFTMQTSTTLEFENY